MSNIPVSLTCVNVEFDAMMSVGQDAHAIKITSVAAHGLTARASTPPHPGDDVTITHGAITVSGQVEWVQGHNFLIISGELIDILGLIGKQLGLGAILRQQENMAA